jgi:hypothetical protein
MSETIDHTPTKEFLLAFHLSDIAAELGAAEDEITRLFKRPNHKMKHWRTKTNERPAGPLDVFRGPNTSEAFLPWAIGYARTRLVDKLFGTCQADLITVARESYGFDASSAWMFIRSVGWNLSHYNGPLESGPFIKWVREITGPAHHAEAQQQLVHHKCFSYSVEVRKCISFALSPGTYEDNKGLRDKFSRKLRNVVDELESQTWRRCAEETTRLIGLSDQELHDAVIKLAFNVADEWRKEAIEYREFTGHKNVEDLTQFVPSDAGQAQRDMGDQVRAGTTWEPNLEGIEPERRTRRKPVDLPVIGYQIVNGTVSRTLSYGHPRSKDFLPALGRKERPLQAVETDQWVKAKVVSGQIKLADLKRQAKVEKNWGKDRITASVKRLNLEKNGLYVKMGGLLVA